MYYDELSLTKISKCVINTPDKSLTHLSTLNVSTHTVQNHEMAYESLNFPRIVISSFKTIFPFVSTMKLNQFCHLFRNRGISLIRMSTVWKGIWVWSIWCRTQNKRPEVEMTGGMFLFDIFTPLGVRIK